MKCGWFNNKVLSLIFLNLLLGISRKKVYCDSTKSSQKAPLELDDFQKSLSFSKNVSKILDKLLKGYDKRLRPNYAGPSVVVGITININNINSVSEVNMDYTMDLYFRQIWVDKRLSFDGVSELVIGSDMLHKIWLPDTYIANDRKTYFHKATVQNKFIRINPDGQILYSMRMTVTAACPMNFRDFPMDYQQCDLELESYGFRMEDIKYQWGQGLNKSALDVAQNIELPQLVYKDFKLMERPFRLSTGVYSRLTMRLYFVRSIGYYIIQIYVPSTLIVILSWVSFWIDRTAAPARVSLGITTVLTMVTFIWSTNASLPKISYIKGIDVYLVACFAMTFFSVIEYGCVSFVHRQTMKREKRAQQKQPPLQEIKLPNQISEVANILKQPPKVLETNSSKQAPFNALVEKRQIQHKSLIMMNELSDKEKSAQSNDNELHNRSNSYSLIRHQSNESPILWEKKYTSGNSLEDLDNSVLPIHIEKQKSCTCNLHQISSRKLEANSPLNTVKSSQNNTLKSVVCNCQKCKLSPSTKSNRQSLVANELENVEKSSGHLTYNNVSSMSQPLINSYVQKSPIKPAAVTDIKKPVKPFKNRLKASTIDNYSRGIFPFVFFTFHIFYWTYYLKIARIGKTQE